MKGPPCGELKTYLCKNKSLVKIIKASEGKLNFLLVAKDPVSLNLLKPHLKEKKTGTYYGVASMWPKYICHLSSVTLCMT